MSDHPVVGATSADDVMAGDAMAGDAMAGGRDIVFYDGDCGYCHGRVRWLRARDRDGRFAFAPLQGELANRLLSGTGFAADAGVPPATLVLIQAPGGRPLEISVKSRAVAAVAAQLPFPWRLGGLILLIPRVAADAAYDWVARRRNSWCLDGSCRGPMS